MATGDCHANVDLVGRLAGQSVFTHLDYYWNIAIPDASSETFAIAVYDDLWSLIQARLTVDFLLEEITVDINNNPATIDPVPYTLVVNETGNPAATQTLPPQATARLIKFPNNTTIEPVTATDFRKGRASFSGFPETDQDNGLMEAAPLIAWQVVADAMEVLNVTFPSGLYAFELGMFRAAGVIPGEPLAKVVLAAVQASQIIGSQNTRKR